MITISSSVLDFGEVTKGKTVSKQITVFSTESTSTDVLITSTSPDYVVAPEELTIDAYGSKSFTVQYTATTLANSSGQIAVSSSVSVDQICNVSATMEIPTANISSNSLNFGQIGIGDSKTLSIDIENTSSEAILTVNASINPSFASNFSFSSYVEIQPLETKTFNIAFTTSISGSISTSLILELNDSVGTYNISLNGEGVYATYSLNPSSISFDSTSVAVGTSSTVSLQITNTHANARLILNSLNSLDSFVTIISNSNVIEPGSSTDLSVIFKPTTPRPVSSSIQISANVSSSPINVPVTGTGVLAPQLVLTSSSINFGKYSLLQDKTLSVTLQNIGIIDLQINSITIPTISNTVITLSESTPFVIPALSSLSLEVTVNSSNNVIFSDNLVIQSNSIGSPHNLSLIGEAQSPEIKINIDELDFGTIYVEASKSIQFTISNTKDVELNVSISEPLHVKVSGPNFVLAANSSITLDATFTLNTTGEINEVLIVNSNDINSSSINIPITGSAIQLELPPTAPPILSSIDENRSSIEFFYTVPEFIINNFLSKGISVSSEITIINRSFSNASLDSMSFTSSSESTATYTITTNDLPVSLEPGESTVLNVIFVAQTSGILSGYLKFEARVGELLEENVNLTVRYEGEAFSPEIEISTTTISFPDTVVGGTEYRSFTINNTSTGAELITDISTDNEVFHFRGKGFTNATVIDSKISLSNSDIVLQSVILTDNVTGNSLVLGDPANVNQFSVNTGSGVITVNPAQEGKSFQVLYDYKQSEVSLTIGRQSSVTVDVGFSPKNVSAQTGTVTISSNDDSNPVLTINVDGSGLTAVTSIIQSHPLLQFEAKINQSVIQKCLLKNTGTVKLFVSNVTSSSTKFTIYEEVQQLLDSGRGFEIDPNETFGLPIVFSPTDESEISANITIDSNAPDLIIPVQGLGLQPEISVPINIDFSDSALNFDKKISLIVSNTGNALLNVQLDLASDFFFISPSVFAVEPGSTYESIVSFRPKETISYSATIKITCDDPNNEEVTIALNGIGALKPVIEVANKLEFVKTNVRETAQATLVITNAGSDSLSLTSMSVIDNAREFNVSFTPTAIQPSTSRNYIVKFIPSKAGKIQGKIKIVSNDTDNPQVEVLLKGEGFQPKGEWQSFDLQDLMPDPVISLANGVNNFISPVKTILSLIKSILSLVKIFLVDSGSALATILKKVQNIINDYVDDLTGTGVYILPIYPRSNYYDQNVIAENGFSKYLASIGGGSAAFKRRIVDSFNDIYDGNRPQFSSSAKVGAFIIAVDSGNLADVVAGIQSLQNIFSATTFEPEIQAPTNVEAIGDNLKVNLRWQIPEIVTFNVMGLFNERNMLEFIKGFNIYRSEKPGDLTIAKEDDLEKKIKKGDVVDSSGNVVKPINGSSPVSSNNYKYLFKNFVGRGDSSTIQSLGFQYSDSGVENNKTYYYTVRTVMSGSSAPMSPLSNEAAGMPQEIKALEENAFLNRCAHFSCFLNQSLTQSVYALQSPIIKMFDKTGQIQQTVSRSEKDKLIPNAGFQQVNTFTITIRNTKIDGSSIVIRNVTVAKERIAANNLEIDFKRFYNENSKKLEDWDSDNTNFDEQKKTFFEILNNTKLVLGYDFTFVKDRENTIITITDISGIGYKQSDHIVIEYTERVYSPTCLYFNNVDSSGQFDNRFDATKCLDGTNKGYCEKYENKRCQYHGGTSCLNVGYTYKGENRCVQNSILFDETFCQNGSNGGTVNFFDKSLRNDSNSCVKTTGICAGYTSIDEETVGAFPNWTSFTVKALIRPIEDFIESLNQWVNREIDAIQKGTSTVADFIDLLGKKIESLEQFIDKLQEIVNIFQTIFSANAGFHILRIDAGNGGVERVKSMVMTAKGGPDSGSNGFTAGVVILIGGPDFDKTWQFLKQIF